MAEAAADLVQQQNGLTVKRIQAHIDRQFEFNQGKNLFYEGILDSLKFSPETIHDIEKFDFTDSGSEKMMVDYLTDRAVQEFCRINQYYAFDAKAQAALRELYAELIANIKKREYSVDLLSRMHYNNLITWLRGTNPFAEKIYTTEGEMIEAVACYEYSPELQMEILQIDREQVEQPVLDVGCGKQGNLVLYLRQNGIEAYGFDRFVDDLAALSNSDWFDYTFERDKWGTIISHLGFSNHFQHHHQRNDGNFIDYARKYMEILNSLRTGGCFHYAPGLPFIERYLDNDKFKITAYKIGNYEFQSVKVQRLR